MLSALMRWRGAFARPLPEGLGLGWFVAGLLAIVALQAQGHEGDLRYWQTWMRALQTGGYGTLEANYPPLLLHWIAIGGAFFSALGLGDGTPMLVKIWVQLPGWLAWMLLLYQVAHALAERGVTPASSGVFWLVVVNPAILIDGPVWGQVDLIAWIPLSLGFLAHARGRHWQGPALFCLALAVKFQSIVFAPIFAGLFLRAVWADRKVLWGLPVAAGVMLLSFLPFILHGRGWAQAGEAYWNNMGRYPRATSNAANLWKITTPYGAHGRDPLPGLEALPWMSPINIGLFLFGAISILIFVAVLRKRGNVWALGVLAMFGFFAFSSAMHERYLFMAVPMAAMWAASEARGRIWLLVATASVTLNITLSHFPKGLYEWTSVSFLIVLAVPFLLAHVFGWQWAPSFNAFADARPRRTVVFAALLPVLFLGHEIQQRLSDRSLDLDVGEARPMVRWLPSSQSNGWGTPRWRVRFWQPPLRFYDRSVSTAIKVHAKSSLVYALPPGRYRLAGFVGSDKEADDRADMHFEVRVDKEPVWTSPTIKRRTASQPLEVEVAGPAELELFVDSNGSNQGDHALWGDVKIQRLE